MMFRNDSNIARVHAGEAVSADKTINPLIDTANRGAVNFDPAFFAVKYGTANQVTFTQRIPRLIEGFLAIGLQAPTIGNSTTATLNVFVSDTNEWTFTLDATVTAGSGTITYGGQTTTSLAYNATASAVQSALQALSSVGTSGIVAGGGPWPTYPISVRGIGYNPSTVTAAGSFTGGSIYVTSGYGFTGETVTVTNRDTSFSRVQGDYLQAFESGSEWRPYEPGIKFAEGVLYSDLSESGNHGANPGTAILNIYSGSGTFWGYRGQQITVTNRDDTYYAPAGTYLVAMQINGEWRPIPTMAPTDEFIWGTLTGALASGGSQTINVYRWNGTAWTASGTFVTVYEFMGISSSLATGTKVYANWHAQSARYLASGKPGC